MEFGQPVTLTASGVISPVRGKLIGFYVNSTTAGTIKLDAAGSGTITPAVGWHFYPIGYPTALNVTLGGVIDVTFIVQPG